MVEITSRDGETLYGALYRPPPEFGEGPHPAIVYVYGGPGAQVVSDHWSMTAALRIQRLRSRGCLVFALDNRGGARRGVAFESAIRRNMGDVEVRDQVDGVLWLVERGLADPDRVGVYGWSYGGYMALMCLLRAPQNLPHGRSRRARNALGRLRHPLYRAIHGDRRRTTRADTKAAAQWRISTRFAAICS